MNPSDSDLDVISSDEDDSEGSLVDFIVNSSDEEEEVDDDEHEDSDVSEDIEDDEDIIQQYSSKMETEGIVTDQNGRRRSTRISKGRPPCRYVDENYRELLLEDVGSDIDHLVDEDSYVADDESEEFQLEE